MVQNNWTQNNKTKANKKTNDKLEEMTSLQKPNLVIDKLIKIEYKAWVFKA